MTCSAIQNGSFYSYHSSPPLRPRAVTGGAFSFGEIDGRRVNVFLDYQNLDATVR